MKHKNNRIVIGAGLFQNNTNWIHYQKDELNILKTDDWLKYHQPNSIQAIVAEHVWEHLSSQEAVTAAKNCYDFLKRSGYVRCAVPDGYFPNQTYQQLVQIGGPGPKDHPAASHKMVYHYHTLAKVFEQVGFQTRLLEFFDQHGSFHYSSWNSNDGIIYRSYRYDHRNSVHKIGFTSLIIDALKTK